MLGHLSHFTVGPRFHGLRSLLGVDLLLSFLLAAFHEAGMVSFSSGMSRIPFCSPR